MEFYKVKSVTLACAELETVVVGKKSQGIQNFQPLTVSNSTCSLCRWNSHTQELEVTSQGQRASSLQHVLEEALSSQRCQ